MRAYVRWSDRLSDTLITLETETVYLRILSMMLVLRNVAAILGALSLFLEKGIPASTFRLLSGP